MALGIPSLGVTSLAGALRSVCAALWLILIAFTGTVAYQQLQQSGLPQQWRDRLFGRPEAATAAEAQRATPKAPEINKPASRRDPLVELDADLKQLGAAALRRYRKHGGVPCEIGDIEGLTLHYRPGRYAFSCSEPIVYTLVVAGEFRPGASPYLRTYHWKRSEFIENRPGARP